MNMKSATMADDMSEDHSNPSKQKLRLWLRMLRATKAVETEMRDKLKSNFNTTLPRFDVMAALYDGATSNEESAITMTALSRKLKVSNGNVTGIVDRLVNDASVERIQSPQDRRASRVMLTQKGREEFETMAASHESWIDDVFGDCPQQDIDKLIDLLDQLNDSVAERLK